MENITLCGLDIAKNIFHLHGADKRGKSVMKKKLTRNKLLAFLSHLPACTLAMEACGSSSYWARQIQKLGHEVKLISPQFVKPFVKSNKNDFNDAEAIAEAASRPTMRYVLPNRVEQQDIQCIHRVRSRLIGQRTALSNQIRGLLAEYGETVSKGVNQLRKRLPEILEEASNELTSEGRTLFSDLYEELVILEEKINRYDLKIKQLFQSNEACQRIGKIEGVGPITATAIVSAVGDPKAFKHGRQFSAWLGLVPRQFSSGGKEKLGGISKRGDSYLRSLLIHGARSVVKNCGSKTSARHRWIASKKLSKGFNKTAVAVANKNARIIWALLAHQDEYRGAVCG